MHEYKLFGTKQEALDYSEQAGKEAGLAYHNGTGTSRYLYSVIEHPVSGEGVCACPEGTVTHKELEANGWFRPPYPDDGNDYTWDDETTSWVVAETDETES